MAADGIAPATAPGGAVRLTIERLVKRGAYPSRRLILLAVALFVASMLVAAAATIWTAREHQLADAERSLSQLSLALAQHTERTVFSLDLVMAGLQSQLAEQLTQSEEQFHTTLGTRQVHELLYDRIRDAPHIDAVVILDRDGNLVNFTRSWPVPAANLSDRDYFQVLSANPAIKSYISEPVLNRTTGQMTFFLAHPLGAAADGAPLGWIMGALTTAYFEEFFARVLPNDGATISLFRRDGLLLARYPDSASFIGKSFGRQPIFTTLLEQSDHGIVRTSASAFDQLARIMAPRAVDRYPLVINVTDLQDNILAHWTKLARVIGIATLLGVLLTAGLGLLLLRHYRLQVGLVRAEAKNISLAIAEADDFESALLAVLQSVSSITDVIYAEAWIPTPDARELRLGPIWHDGAAELAAYAGQRRRLKILAGTGQTAHAWQTRQAVWVPDLDNNPFTGLDSGSWGRKAGLSSAYVVPICSGADVLAVLRFGQRGARKLDQRLTETINGVAPHLGTALLHKRAEQALRESEQMAREIVATALDAFIQIDESRLVCEWNPQAESLFGWSRADAIGQSLAALIGPSALQATGLSDWLTRGDQGSTGRRFELEARTRGGRILQMELAATLLPRPGGKRFNFFLRDVTRRRAVEKQLLQAQKMEAVGNLTGGLAHDFNNLLGVIIGNLDLVCELLPDDRAIQEMSGDARAAAERGSNLVRRLLAFARRQPLMPETSDANALIAGIVKLLQRTLGEQIDFELKLAADLWPVRIDPTQLEAAITNLATNARDAMPRGGRLTFATSNVGIASDDPEMSWKVAAGDYVRIDVSDTGSGIPPEVVGRIFEPFFTTKEEGKGSGLGLSMVFGFISQSGGHVTVETEADRGSTFSLYLPRWEGEQVELSAPSSATPELRGSETILVVEDNDMMRAVAVRQLASMGYRTLEARSAAAALEILASDQPIDLLFSDVVMPGRMDGIELAASAESLRPRLKILLTSGFHDAGPAGRQRSLPIHRLLTKPYRKEVLARAVRDVLEHDARKPLAGVAGA